MAKYPKHIEYVLDNYGEDFKHALMSRGVQIDIEQAMENFIAADPTPDKNLVDWLVQVYIKEGFRYEDIAIEDQDGCGGLPESKLGKLLKDYQACFSQIPRAERNIYQYGSYGELYRLIQPYRSKEVEDQSASGQEHKRRERQAALDNSYIVYRDQRMIVAVPLTQEASCWWGRGTQWCTAATKSNNYFDRYNHSASLIVINILGKGMKGKGVLESKEQAQQGSKFQLWVGKNDTQLTDETDSFIDGKIIEMYWNHLEPIISWAIEQNGYAFKLVPQKFITIKLCKKAVEQTGQALMFIPKNLRTLEVCKLAVNSEGMALFYVPEEIITAEICEIATKQNVRAFSYVPARFRTPELCKLAVEQDGNALMFVPEQLKTPELCKLSVAQEGASLYWVPKHYRTAELCKIAVSKSRAAYIYVPEQLKTPELYRMASNPVTQRSRVTELPETNRRTKAMFEERKWTASVLESLEQKLKLSNFIQQADPILPTT